MAAHIEDHDRSNSAGRLTDVLAAKGYKIDSKPRSPTASIPVATKDEIANQRISPGAIRFVLDNSDFRFRDYFTRMNMPADIYYDPLQDKVCVPHVYSLASSGSLLFDSSPTMMYFYVNSSCDNFLEHSLPLLPDKPPPRIHPTPREHVLNWIQGRLSHNGSHPSA